MRAKITKEKRKELENKLEEFIQHSRQRLEIFTGWDYYLAGSDAIWRRAYSKISKMPNYELIGICENIDEENKTFKFSSYYDVFDWEK